MPIKCSDSSDVVEFLDSILDVLEDGIYITNCAGMTLKVNSVYEQLTGLSKQEMLGRNVNDLKQEGKYDTILNPEIVKTGKPVTSSVQITRAGRKVILSGYPVFDQFGKVALVVTFVRDFTLLCELKEQITNQQTIIDKFQKLTKKDLRNSSITFISQAMTDLTDRMNKIARTDATILILGETGVGKDVISRKIHEQSLRCNELFFKVDCASIPEHLIESELFGYAPGAFSGANAKGKPGFFEIADKGTLFLDEVGELPLPMQAKLLRVLQDQEIIRIGATKVKKVDVRFISATNRDLELAVEEGTFRSDLYYRLHVAVLNAPPLRELKEDILPLANYFLGRFNTKYRKGVSLSKEVEAVFQAYKWPGNIREMENLIQSLVIMQEKEVIEVKNLPADMCKRDNTMKVLVCSALNIENKSINEIMSEVEKELISKALDKYGSIPKVAEFFKVDRTTIFRKAKKYSLI